MAVNRDQIPPGLVSITDAATALHVGRQSVSKWVRRGLIRGWRSEIGQQTFVDLEEVRSKLTLQPLDMSESGGDS